MQGKHLHAIAWPLLATGLLTACDNRSSTTGSTSNTESGLGFSFTNITASTGIDHRYGIATPTPNSMSEFFGGGVAAGDYDNDGDIDLYFVSGDVDTNKLFRNEGNNVFVDVSVAAGLSVTAKGSGPAFADLNGDGWMDLFIGGLEQDLQFVFQNNGDGTFADITALSGINITVGDTISAAFGDFDVDGDLDLFVTHWGASRQSDTEHLWENDGNGVFSSASIASDIANNIIVRASDIAMLGSENIDYTFTPNFSDINNDGYPDLLVVADFETSQVFINDRDGTFTNTTNAVIKDQNGMGAAIMDFDNDGFLDWFVSAIYAFDSLAGKTTFIGNRLYHNNGDGSFEDVTDVSHVAIGNWGWGSCAADFNNDGHIDIFHTNGWNSGEYTGDTVKLFLANGDGTFRARAAEANLVDAGQGRGVSCFDSDRDGDIDILITNNDDNAVVLYRNDGGNNANYINIKLNGIAPNTEAIGARIYVTANEVTQMRELRAGSNFVSQNPTEQHFGLGNTSQIEEIRIVWPKVEGSPVNDTVLNAEGVNRFVIINHQAL